MKIRASKYTALIAVLVSVFLLSGSVSWSDILVEQTITVDCCDKEHDVPYPLNAEECSDCGCFSCIPSLRADETSATSAGVFAPSGPYWSLKEKNPSDHINSIDYPPETV